MSPSIRQASDEIARLVAQGASSDRIAAAREKRACAERLQEELDTARLLLRIEYRATRMTTGLNLSHDDVKLLAAELRRLKGGAE